MTDDLKKFVEDLDTRLKKLEDNKKEEKKDLEEDFNDRVFGKKKEQ